MNFLVPDTRLAGDTPLRQAQLVMLRLLKAFHQLCEEEGLRYWLDAGTLLGAVRHGGFIPWDDDIDVLMPREDYLRFCALAPEALPPDMFFQSPETDPGFVCPWVKIRDRYSHLVESTGPYPYSQAIFIDIFPAVRETRRQLAWRTFYPLLAPLSKRPEPVIGALAPLSAAKRLVVGGLQYAFLALMGLSPLRRAFLDYVGGGRADWTYEPPIRYTNHLRDEDIFPLKSIRFEDAEFWGPANPQGYLRDYFGDFMTLPPPEKRRSEHNVDAIFPTGPNPHRSGLEWTKGGTSAQGRGR